MKLIVSKTTENALKTGFVTTLKSTETVDLGLLGKKSVNRTYYISAPNEVAVDTEIELDLNLFDIKVRPWEFTDSETGEQKEIDCKWLHLKASA